MRYRWYSKYFAKNTSLIWCNAVWINKSPWKLELTSISSFWPKSGIYFSIGVKNLYAMVVGIGYNDSIRIAYGDVMRMLQMSGFTAHNTEFAHKRAIRLKNLWKASVWKSPKKVSKKWLYLYSMVFFVTNINKTQCISSNTPRITELSINGSLTPKAPNEMSRSVKDLNTMIVSIGNNVLANLVDRYTGQAIKFALAVAIATKAEPVLSMLIEHLNSVIGGIGDDYGVVWTHGNASWPSKQSWLTSSWSKSHQ